VLKLLDQRKQANLQWLQNPSQSNGDNLNSVKHETGRTSSNIKREDLKEKFAELHTNSKNRNITDFC
jgi:hypothetical protein